MCFVFSACDPVFTKEVRDSLSSIHVAQIPDRSGMLLRTNLQQMLAQCDTRYFYDLEVDLKIFERALEMGEDAKIKLLHVVLKAPFILKREGNSVYEGQAETYYYRTLTPSFYTQTTTQSYISEEGVHQLAQSIVLDLAKFFNLKKLDHIKP